MAQNRVVLKEPSKLSFPPERSFRKKNRCDGCPFIKEDGGGCKAQGVCSYGFDLLSHLEIIIIRIGKTDKSSKGNYTLTYISPTRERTIRAQGRETTNSFLLYLNGPGSFGIISSSG